MLQTDSGKANISSCSKITSMFLYCVVVEIRTPPCFVERDRYTFFCFKSHCHNETEQLSRTAELALPASRALSSPEQRAAENRCGAGGVPEEMGGVADTQVCFGVKLVQNCDH